MALFRKRQAQDPEIELTATGFRSGETNVSWESIEAIRVFKLDLLAWDEIRFSFQLAGVSIQVSEEQPGFSALLGELERRFPSVVGWHAQVSQPAFARNETELWRRS